VPASLKDQVAVVTGAGRGIGRAEALLLASEGAAVVVNDLSNGPADEVVAEILSAGGRAVASYDSVTTMPGGQAMVDAALGAFGRLDIVVNNAGITRHRMFHEMTEAEWDEVITVDLKGHFTVTRAAAPIFRKQRSGRIINTSSDAGLGTIGACNYSAAKEGVVGLTRSLALELGRYGVTVNALRPWAATRLSVTDQLDWSVDVLAKAGQVRVAESLSRLTSFEPASVAALVAWLCGKEAAHVNGRTFLIAGPQVALFREPVPGQALDSRQQQWSLEDLTRAMPAITGLPKAHP
jgi:NAD(P)-dependent dehydrogenase (short-subunit alcohol dehydrogenase family)